MKNTEAKTRGSNSFPTRRGFLRTTVGATFAAAVSPNIIPSSVLGRDGAVAPSNRVVVGFIGVGPQGQGVMGNYLPKKDCQVVAVCDVKTDMLNQARDRVNAQYQNQDCATYHDFREITRRADIDACHIATPDHWHVLASLEAVRNKKDVYCEKPLGLSQEERRILRSEVNKYKRVFQFGTQQRSSQQFWQACSLVRNGHIGKLKSINVWSLGSTPGGSTKVMDPPPTLDYDFWLGPAPFKPFTEDRCTHDGGKKTWWFNTDYALGFIAGWGIHPLDIALWGSGDLLQGKVEIQGKAIYGDTAACNTARVWDIDIQLSSGIAMKFVGIPNGGNAGKPTGDPYYYFDDWKKRYRRISDHGTAFEGDHGWVHVDRGGINLEPETLAEVKKDGFKNQLIQSGDHVSNFLQCVKSRDKTVCPIEDAVLGDTMCHIADLAARAGRTLTYDLGREDFDNDPEASRRLHRRDIRKPWVL